jgi:CheY-like chemotaxis protein
MNTKILVVDDDIDFREATRVLLEAKGFAVISASDGDEAYAKAKADGPALILLDVMMAHESEGFETARKLREDPATNSIPVILVTGIRRKMNLPFGPEPDDHWLPVKAVLEKPVKPEVLLRTINEALKA